MEGKIIAPPPPNSHDRECLTHHCVALGAAYLSTVWLWWQWSTVWLWWQCIHWNKWTTLHQSRGQSLVLTDEIWLQIQRWQSNCGCASQVGTRIKFSRMKHWRFTYKGWSKVLHLIMKSLAQLGVLFITVKTYYWLVFQFLWDFLILIVNHLEMKTLFTITLKTYNVVWQTFSWICIVIYNISAVRCDFEKSTCGWHDASSGDITWTNVSASTATGLQPKRDTTLSNGTTGMTLNTEIKYLSSRIQLFTCFYQSYINNFSCNLSVANTL